MKMNKFLNLIILKNLKMKKKMKIFMKVYQKSIKKNNRNMKIE